MSMLMARSKKTKKSSGQDKNPYDRRSEKITDKAFKSVEKGVKPVVDVKKSMKRSKRRDS